MSLCYGPYIFFYKTTVFLHLYALFTEFTNVSHFSPYSTYAAVAGKPGEGQGLLRCEGMTEDTIALFWEPPIHDGGKPVTGYVLEKREHGSEIWTKYVSPLDTPFVDHQRPSVHFSRRCRFM